jgi:hypothetical protein
MQAQVSGGVSYTFLDVPDFLLVFVGINFLPQLVEIPAEKRF